MKRIKLTYSELIQELCKKKGKTQPISLAQMKELVGHLADLFYKIECSYVKDLGARYFHPIPDVLLQLGRRRHKKRSK